MRTCLAPFSVLFVLGVLGALLYTVPARSEAKTPEEIFELLKKRWDESATAEIQDRILLVEEFANAPCRKTVEFLKDLYKSEENIGLYMSVTRTLGRIGSLEAVRYLVAVGAPLLAADEFAAMALGDAFDHRFEAKAEEWVLRSGLKEPALRKNKEVWLRVLKAAGRFESPQRVAVLLRELSKSEPQEIVAILESLEDATDRQLVKAATQLTRHRDPSVQVAAMNLLFAQGGAGESRLFERGLQNPHWQIRLLSLRMLARLEHKRIVDYAVAALDDKEPKVQVVAVRILLDHGGHEVMLPLIRHLETTTGRVQDDILDALTRLTGKDFGPSAFQWEGWWEQHGRHLEKIVKLSAKEFSEAKAKEADRPTSVLYYGLRVASDRAVFIIDCSESMREQYVPLEEREGEDAEGRKGKTAVDPRSGQPGGVQTLPRRTKLSVAQSHLKRVVGSLGEGKRFDIIRFESVIAQFVRDALGLEPNRLVPMNDAIRAQAAAFIDEAEPMGQTYMLKALETAFENEEVDTIFLLSDGAPTPADTAGMDVILQRMRSLNRLRCVKVHTIGFDLKEPEKEFLRQLADEHFGVFIAR